MDQRDLGMVAVGVGTGALAATAYQAWRAASERTVLDGKPTTLARVDAARLTQDPDTFQFKSGGDSKGVTDRLKGVKTWNPAAAGKVMVFERADGQQVIADGHQRTGLAQRLMSDGHAPIKMDAIVLREKDGWSARDVRAYAAIKNMHESSGNPLDMAKVMRERPDLVTSSLPVTDAKIRDAKSLANLSEPAFRMVTSGTVKPEIAAAVGESVKEASRHVDLLSEMQKAKVETAQHAKLYVGQAMAGPSVTQSNLSLFGEETQTRSLIAERAQVLDRAMTALRNDKKIFGLLEREAQSIEAAGNKLAHETNIAKAEGAQRTATLVEKLSTVRGPLSSMLDDAAKMVADGKKPAEAARGFVRQVGAKLRDGGIQALTTEGSAGWSDEARVASAKTRRKANAGAMEMVEKPNKQSSFLPNPTTKEKIASASKGKGKASVPQKDAGGLFSDDAKQMDIVDEVRKAPAPGARKAKHEADMARINQEIRDTLGPRGDGKHRHVDGSPIKPEPRGMDGLTRAERSGKAAKPVVPAATVAEGGSTLDRFRAAYEATLAEQVKANPGKYAYGPDRAPDMAKRMTDALAAGNGDVQSPTVKAVAKALGIKPTVGGLKAALNDQPAPAPKPPVDGLSTREFNTVKRTINSGGSVNNALVAKATNAQLQALDDASRAARMAQTGGNGDWGKINQIEAWRTAIRDAARQQTNAVVSNQPTNPNYTPGVGTTQESYWTAKAGPTPTVNELPPGAFKGTQAEFESLSPGMRREIKRSADKVAAAEPTTSQWLADREARVEQSKAAGNKHLDGLPRAVEGMRGVEFHNVHDPKERGIVRTVANTGEVVVDWADKYSADKNLADPVKDGKKTVHRSWLAPTDLRDYVAAPKGGVAPARVGQLETRAKKLSSAVPVLRAEAVEASSLRGIVDEALIEPKIEQAEKRFGQASMLAGEAQTKAGEAKGYRAAFENMSNKALRDLAKSNGFEMRHAPDGAAGKADVVAKLLAKGVVPPGWSDAARAASAEVRAENAKPKGRPRFKDPAVQALLKDNIVTRDDVRSSKSMAELEAKRGDRMTSQPHAIATRAPTFAQDQATLEQRASKPAQLTNYQKQFQAGPRQAVYYPDPDAPGTPTGKSRGQLLAEARQKGIKGIARMETRTLAAKLGYKLNYALGAMTIGGAAAAGLLAADAARNSAHAAGKSAADTQLDTMKAGVVATAVAGGTIAAIGKGIQITAAAIPKIAPFVTPVGAAVGLAYATYGAVEGWKQTGTIKGAALGAVSGGHVFESWRKPTAGPVRLSVTQQAAFAAAQIEHRAKQDAAIAEKQNDKPKGWSNAARIAAAKAQNHAAPYGGNPYSGPAQWAPPPPVASESSTTSIAQAMKKK